MMANLNNFFTTLNTTEIASITAIVIYTGSLMTILYKSNMKHILLYWYIQSEWFSIGLSTSIIFSNIIPNAPVESVIIIIIYLIYISLTSLMNYWNLHIISERIWVKLMVMASPLWRNKMSKLDKNGIPCGIDYDELYKRCDEIFDEVLKRMDILTS